MIKISASVVLYNTEKIHIDTVISSCIGSLVTIDLYLVDNSPNDKLNYLMDDNRFRYLKSHENHGFGAGHNLAINEFKILENYDYHIIINPDIEFDIMVVEKIQKYMDCNNDVGILMPKIINIDGSLQYARRLLPSPMDILIKRFFPSSKRAQNFDLRKFEPKKPVEIIGLCGCFMFARTSALKKIGLFDERYFMYFEDYDLSRRMAKSFKTIYFPSIEVVHVANNEHRRNKKLFFYSIRAALKYFNKWGYVDKFRNKNNERILQIVMDSSE